MGVRSGLDLNLWSGIHYHVIIEQEWILISFSSILPESNTDKKYVTKIEVRDQPYSPNMTFLCSGKEIALKISLPNQTQYH